jgi:hypothetical protein
MSTVATAFDLALEPLVIANHVGAGLLARLGVPETFISRTAFPAEGEFRKNMQMQTSGTVEITDNGGPYSRVQRDASAEEEFEDVTSHLLVSRATPEDDPHPRTAAERFLVSQGIGHGAWLALSKVHKTDGTVTEPFVTFLGAPVVAEEAFASVALKAEGSASWWDERHPRHHARCSARCHGHYAPSVAVYHRVV